MAFGHQQAAVNRDIRVLYDLISGVAPTLKAYESVGASADFYHRSAFVAVKDLALAATVCSPMAFDVSEDDDLYFILPLHGEACATSQKKSTVASPVLGAAITPGHDRKGIMTEMSMLQATLKPERLQFTALTMLGPAFRGQIEDRLGRPQVLAPQAGSVRFDQLFSNLCKTIDDCGLQCGALNALGFDDVFYRAVVAMAFAERLMPQVATPGPVLKDALDRVCDHIDAHLTEPIYLTDLEAIGQLSTRSLQYAFLRRFGCSPTVWIRQRRLQLAHRRLMQAAPFETVTAIALECGFSNLGDFARMYFKHYGELPKSALGRSTG